MKWTPLGCLMFQLAMAPLVLSMAPLVLADTLDYNVVYPDGYTGGRFHGSDVFERRDAWQSFDPEIMPEVYPSEPLPLPEPVVVMYSPTLTEPVVQEIMNELDPVVPLEGEARIFSEISDDIQEQQCFAMGLSRGCDPDTGFTGELTFETESGRSVGSDMLGASNFYRRLEALEEEPDIEDRFRLLEESFAPDFSPLFDE